MAGTGRCWRQTVAGVAAALLLAGCGGGGAAGPKTIDILAGDNFRFQPAEIRARPNEQVTVRVRNPGALVHDFVTRGQARDARLEIAAGQTATITFTAAARPGRYEFVCTQPGHEQAGMKGTIVVE